MNACFIVTVLAAAATLAYAQSQYSSAVSYGNGYSNGINSYDSRGAYQNGIGSRFPGIGYNGLQGFPSAMISGYQAGNGGYGNGFGNFGQFGSNSGYNGGFGSGFSRSFGSGFGNSFGGGYNGIQAFPSQMISGYSTGNGGYNAAAPGFSNNGYGSGRY